MKSADIMYYTVAYAVCPFCEAEQSIDDDRGEMECEECSQSFSYNTDI